MTKRRWAGIILGIAMFLGVVGAALAVTVFQVSREIDAELVLSAVEVLSDDNLGVYWDREFREPVTFIEFRGADFEPPLRPEVGVEWVYVVNHSDKELVLIEPCHGIPSPDPDGEDIADVSGGVRDLDGEWMGSTCDREVPLAAGEAVRAAIHIDIREGLGEPGNYPFVVVFGAVGEAEEPAATPARIAFTSTRDGNFEIYVMEADGSNQTRLTDDSASDYDPSSSPDGNKIAFTSRRDGDDEINDEIYVIDRDGSGLTRLTHNPASDQSASWSPDGSKIAFASNRESVALEIYLMNADGSNPTRLTFNGATDIDPVWSPDGAKIAFESRRDVNDEIYVMNADGSNQTNLSRNAANEHHADWSPDGTKIVFATSRHGKYNIYVMDADGSNQTLVNIPSSAVDNDYPTWSPNGEQIVFASNPFGDYDLFVMDALGSKPRRLTESDGDDLWPDRSPGTVAP